MKNGKNRFIYITPFLSVLEQNAFEIKKIIKGENRIEEEDSLFGIIEHHSNMVCETETDDDDKKVLYRSYLGCVAVHKITVVSITNFKKFNAKLKREVTETGNDCTSSKIMTDLDKLANRLTQLDCTLNIVWKN